MLLLHKNVDTTSIIQPITTEPTVSNTGKPEGIHKMLIQYYPPLCTS